MGADEYLERLDVNIIESAYSFILKYSKIAVCTNTLLSAPTTNSETTMNPDFHEFFIQSDEQQYLKNQQTISRS